PFALQMVFALHVYAFLLLLYGAAIVVSAVEGKLGGAGLDSGILDKILTALIASASALYLFVAVSRVYGAAGAARVVASLGLAIAVLAITLAYRFRVLVLDLRGTVG